MASALACFVTSCARLHPTPVDATLRQAAIYQRATNQFALAEFYKPAEAETNHLAFTLAPLIIQEVDGANAPLPSPDRFGMLSFSNGTPRLNPSLAVVYWQADTVTLHGNAHARLAYWWFYSCGPPRSPMAPCLQSSEPGEGGLAVQGVRITLNSDGQPVIWEALADSSGASLIFVSQRLEAAAAAQFGKALPGRRYATERSLEEAPNVIVARVIDDGPVAMGPIAYLRAGTRSISTLICRCMPAQVKELRDSTSYCLRPLPPAAGQSFLPSGAQLTPRSGFWPGDTFPTKPLEECLRLPSL
ncbi:MAG TPA: hypothetical protein PLC99_21960 [Verrucomicrobiota bacterium]|nr:hypothetical protein [Verrucomicrobiota bacterium]